MPVTPFYAMIDSLKVVFTVWSKAWYNSQLCLNIYSIESLVFLNQASVFLESPDYTWGYLSIMPLESSWVYFPTPWGQVGSMSMGIGGHH
jgi:hypothetical protein